MGMSEGCQIDIGLSLVVFPINFDQLCPINGHDRMYNRFVLVK